MLTKEEVMNMIKKLEAEEQTMRSVIRSKSEQLQKLNGEIEELDGKLKLLVLLGESLAKYHDGEGLGEQPY